MVFRFVKSGFDKVKQALTKTRNALGNKVRDLFQGKVDEETFEKLEELLYQADLGVSIATELTEKVRNRFRGGKVTVEEVIAELEQDLLKQLPRAHPLPIGETPHVILIAGVNGNGKTTTCAKLAHRYMQEGHSVLLGAADTFRAAAIEQLDLWADRLSAQIVKGKPGSDSAAVIFDTLTAAKARNVDVVIIDTAGRLHTKTELMRELEKMQRICKKVLPESPHETLLVLDANVGQNGIDQAKTFKEFIPITGLVLTKLDGTAKGGGVFPIQKKLGIPVKYIGLGEGIEDFEVFNGEAFVKALFER